MKRVKKVIVQLNHLSDGIVWVSTLSLLLPLLVLAGFGLYAVVKYGYILYFTASVLASFLLVYTPLLLLNRGKKTPTKSDETPQQSLVDASADWSETEVSMWQRLNTSVDEQLAKDDSWGSLKAHGYVLASLTAKEFERDDLEFSVTDGLKMLEEISRRYRAILKKNVPLAEKVKVSHLKFIYDNQDNIETGKKVYGYASIAYRFSRMMNPQAAVIAEIRTKLLGNMSDQATDNLQLNMKRAFLQEVVAVSIDLYSGRFSIDDDNITQSAIAVKDQARQAPPLEPLRIAVVGQISAGKSSLVNAIIGAVNAEVSTLPSTDKVTVYACHIDGTDVLNLIDLPGLDGNDKNQHRLLKEVTQADMVLWVLKANQSARQIDHNFMHLFQAFYHNKDNLQRKKPVVVGVLNQIDKLKPVADLPPYNLHKPSSDKEKIIVKAVDHNRQMLNLETVIATSIGHNTTFGLEDIKQIIVDNIDAGTHVQLNRQRLDSRQSGIKEQLKRAINGGWMLFDGISNTSTDKRPTTARGNQRN